MSVCNVVYRTIQQIELATLLVAKISYCCVCLKLWAFSVVISFLAFFHFGNEKHRCGKLIVVAAEIP